MMSPNPFEHKNALLKKEHMEIYILSRRTDVCHHAVEVHNTGIKCQNERILVIFFVNLRHKLSAEHRS